MISFLFVCLCVRGPWPRLLSCVGGIVLVVFPEFEEKPNVLLIYTDDQDFGEVGAYGGKVYSPTIDKLAAHGMRMERLYVTSPICTPVGTH